jgi:hypothetical protein
MNRASRHGATHRCTGLHVIDFDEPSQLALLQTSAYTITATTGGKRRREKAGSRRHMDMIDCGAATAGFEISADGIVSARMLGLLVPANAGALSARLLQAAVDRGALGIVCEVDRALVALPTIDPKHYAYVPPPQRRVPVAVVVSPEQWCVYERIPQAAAQSGAIRRAFLSHAEAEAWLRQQARALAANQLWWSVRR